jgi:helicase required for RNAi-mediated heterochromatin assembly 1
MESDAWQILDTHVRRTWDTGKYHEQWRNLPEIPTKAEIMPKDEEEPCQRKEEERWNDYQNDPIYDPKLPKNIVDGPWPSKKDYISAHYQILREDAIAPLREAVKFFRQHRHMDDDNYACIYTHVSVFNLRLNILSFLQQVHFKGLNLSPFGAAFKVTFSTERAGKQIRWEQSKRLLQGTMVALSPASDMFEKVCKIAIVAARPIADGLDQNPPVIDLFWGDHMDVAFDPVERKDS